VSRAWQLGQWEFHPVEQRLLRDGHAVPLPRKVSEVLRILVERAGQVVSRDSLIEDVWAGNTYTGGRGLTNAIWQLRRLLDDGGDDEDRSAIETISRNGYRLRVVVLPLVLAAPSDSDAPVQPEMVAVPRRRAPGVWMLASLVFLVIAIGGWGLLKWRSRPAPVDLQPVSLTLLDGAEEFPAISRDGRQLAFMWERPDHPARVMVGPANDPAAQWRDVSVGALDEGRPQWSADGRSLALLQIGGEHECEVLIRDLASLHDRVVAPCFYERLHQVYDWSPDGKMMAIARLDPHDATVQLILHRLSDDSESVLTHPANGEQDSQVAWSPDGRSLAFVRRNLAVGELFVLDVATGRQRQLTHDAAPIYGLAWRGDGKGIVFNSMRDGGYALWQVSPDGGAPQLYARLDVPFNLSTIWGTDAAVAVSQHRSAEHIEIRSADAATVLATLSSAGRDLYAQWSVVTRRLLFLSTRSGRLALWSAQADGSDARALPRLAGVASIPAVSPVDARYAVPMQLPGQSAESIFVADDASAPLRAVLKDGNDYSTVSWLPDGSGLVVGSNRDGGWALWRLRFADGDMHKLTSVPAMYGVMDANGVLYYSRRDEPGLWRQLPGRSAQRIVDDLGVDDWGNWALHGDTLIYLLRDPEHDRLMQSRPDGSGAHELIALPRNAVRYYRSVSVMPDGRLILTMLGRRQADIVALRPGGG